MKVFFLDLWLDLKEKRLAPVAIILAAAIVAVPFVVKKDDEETPPPPVATTASAAPAAPVVQGESTDIQTDSRLTVFSPRDPFESTSAPASTTGSSESGGGGSSGATTTTTTTESSGGGGSGSGTSGGGTTGSEPTSGTGNGTGTGSGTSTGTTTTGTTKTTVFTYTVDLRFGEAGDIASYRNVKRLELIPNEDNPKVVFLGVTTTAKTAVFLVDASIGVDTGEGRCRPSADECTFLYLRPDEDHDQATLTDSDGTVFHLRLVDINRVSVSSSNGTSGSDGSSGGGNSDSTNSPAFTGSAGRSSDTVPGEAPPGEPNRKPFTYQGFFADSSSSK